MVTMMHDNDRCFYLETRADGSTASCYASRQQHLNRPMSHDFVDGLVYSRLRYALKHISRGIGPYSRDQLTHANDTIEAMKETARVALTPGPVEESIEA